MGTTPASGGFRFGGKVSETTNVIPFPATRRARRLLADGASCLGPGDYEFTEQELVDLTLAVTTINAWNRINISVRAEPGTNPPPAHQ